MKPSSQNVCHQFVYRPVSHNSNNIAHDLINDDERLYYKQLVQLWTGWGKPPAKTPGIDRVSVVMVEKCYYELLLMSGNERKVGRLK